MTWITLQDFLQHSKATPDRPGIVPSDLDRDMDYLFADEHFHLVVVNTLLALAALKMAEPTYDVSRINMADSDWSLRSLCRVVSEQALEWYDKSLISLDPIAGGRRNLMEPKPFDEAYDGKFKDSAARRIFIATIARMQNGEHELVWDVLRMRFDRLSKSRKPIVPIEVPLSDAEAIPLITGYVAAANSGARRQAVVAAIAMVDDPSVGPIKHINANDRDGPVDINGTHYGIEVVAGLNGKTLIDKCNKVRSFGKYTRLTIVCDTCSNKADMLRLARDRYGDLDVRIALLEDYLRAIAGHGFGHVTYEDVCNSISRVVQNLPPFDANAWHDLINDRINASFTFEGNRIVYLPSAVRH